MKKQTTKQKDLRADWKNEFQDEFIQLQDDIDTLEIPEDLKEEIEKYLNRFKDRVNDAINNFEVTAEIAAKDVDLDDFLSQNKYDGLKEDDANTMKDMLEMEGYFVMKAPSLSEQYKIEAFMEDMKNNPYQLTLVA
jgi:hypothetical protein